MAAAMAGEEGDLAAFKFTEDKGVGGRTEGRLDEDFLLRLEPRHGIESAAADDADFRFHVWPS